MTTFPYQKKAECIAADLRTRITTGEFAEGDRLPTRAELRQNYQVTSDTLQRALNWLIEEGFVESAGRRGTFVSDTPPHRTNYALLFPNRFYPGRGPTNLFFKAMYDEALSRSGERQFKIFDGFSGRAGFMEYESLLEDVACNRLAGLIFCSAPFELVDTPLMADDGVPRTAFMAKASYPHVPAVTTSFRQFSDAAVAQLHGAGCRNSAVLLNASLDDDRVGYLRQALTDRQMLKNPNALLGLSVSRGDWAANIVRLLFDVPAENRPDSLILADDHLVEPATAALAELGLRCPDEVRVISYTNFPWPAESHVPTTRIGFSITQLLDSCVANIDRVRAGEPPDAFTVLPVITQDTPAMALSTH